MYVFFLLFLFGNKVSWAFGKCSDDIWAPVHNPVITADVQNQVRNPALTILN